MKSYRITVNGNVYDVTVEETTGNGAAPVQQSAAPAPQPVKTQQAAPQPARHSLPRYAMHTDLQAFIHIALHYGKYDKQTFCHE